LDWTETWPGRQAGIRDNRRVEMTRSAVLGLLLLGLAALLPAQMAVLSDDMTNFPSGWTLGTSGLHRDTWTRKTARWNSSGFSAKCSRHDTMYSDSANCWMARPVALAGYPAGVLTFMAWQRSEGGYDYLHFEYSTDGGTSWTTLWSRSGTAYASWRRVSISNIPGNTNAIRFRFASDVSGHVEGVYLDDVVLYGIDTTGITPFADNMDNFPSGWVLRSSDSLYWGPETLYRHSPRKAAQCAARDSGYRNNMDTRMTRFISPRAGAYASFGYWLYSNIEDEADWVDIQYHQAGGSWAMFLHDSASHGWRPYDFELPATADSIRFRFRSDVSNTARGVYVDDVVVHDFAARAVDFTAVSVDSPAAEIDSGALVPVRATIRNNGPARAGLPVYFQIGTGSAYRPVVFVETLAAGAARSVAFPDWKADVRPGVYALKCSVAYFIDGYPANDVIYDSVIVANKDYGMVSILHPAATEPPGAVTPQVVVRNHGITRGTGSVTLAIPLAGYNQTLPLSNGLPVRTDTTIIFPVWTAARGDYAVTCSTHQTGDQIPANNSLGLACHVADTGWVTLATVPPGLRGKQVKDGGCLTSLDGTHPTDTSHIYLLKGNGTCEYYAFNTALTSWTAKESIPAINSYGRKKAVKKGGAIAQAGGRMYAAKGNSSLDWWQYDPALSGSPTYPWTQKTDVPMAAKTVKEGTGAAAVTVGDTAFVFFLRGSGGLEFLRYNTVANTWLAMTTAPTGPSGKPYKDGSCLAYDRDANAIYALKGSYNELYAYSVGTGTWSTRFSLPFTGSSGKKKKAKSGAGMAYRDGYIYCLKGNNTNEFWRYNCALDQWAQLGDVPFGSGRAVKGGGAIVYAQVPDALYLTKGNNTLDFFKYGLPAYGLQLTANSQNEMSSGRQPSAVSRLLISPNPFSATTAISYTLPNATNHSLKLYDVTGRLISTLASGHRNAGSYSLAASGQRLAVSGVYVLKLTANNTTFTAKLIIE
jgi:hypothetical protein